MQEFHYDRGGGVLVEQWADWYLANHVYGFDGRNTLQWLKYESAAEAVVDYYMGRQGGVQARREALARRLR